MVEVTPLSQHRDPRHEGLPLPIHSTARAKEVRRCQRARSRTPAEAINIHMLFEDRWDDLVKWAMTYMYRKMPERGVTAS